MPIALSCEKCKKKYNVMEQFAGKALRCRECQNIIRVPATRTQQPEEQHHKIGKFKLEEMRRKLLDLTRRNSLLNHKTKGRRSLKIVDEVPREVYRILVDKNKKMSFYSKEEASEDVVWESEEVLPTQITDNQLSLGRLDSETVAKRHVDEYLQTSLTDKALQTRLLFLTRESRSALLEQGYNILYLTLGVIEWTDGSKETTARAPLIFLPIESARKTVNHRHKISLFDDDIILNPCLVELCKRQFRLELPPFDQNTTADELDDYFLKIQQSINNVPYWSFTPDIHIGLFSFAKLLMYNDLDSKNWPENSNLLKHDLICQLTGLNSNQDDRDPPLIPPEKLDEVLNPLECFQVMDADSSQQAAILAAKKGTNLVIQGPPGTGKSQTITNIIAELLADHKTILFVAEKVAALEVVKRRLESVGLGDFVLELHSRKASKKAVFQEFARVIALEGMAKSQYNLEAHELQKVKTKLNQYKTLLHTPQSNLQQTTFEVLSKAIALSDEEEAICDIPNTFRWTHEQFSEGIALIEKFDRSLERVGDPNLHPWRGSNWKHVTHKISQHLDLAYQRLKAALSALRKNTKPLAFILRAELPQTIGQTQMILEMSEKLLATPILRGTRLTDQRWTDWGHSIKTWAQAGVEWSKHRSEWLDSFKEEAEDQEWKEILERRIRHKTSFFRWFRPSWYSDSRVISDYANESKKLTVDEQIKAIRLIEKSRKIREKLEEKEIDYGGMLGQRWEGLLSNWNDLCQFVESLIETQRYVQNLNFPKEEAQRLLEDEERRELRIAHQNLYESLSKLYESLDYWVDVLECSKEGWFEDNPSDILLDQLEGRLAEIDGKFEHTRNWAAYNESFARCHKFGLKSFLDWTLTKRKTKTPDRLAHIFKRQFYHLWLDNIYRKSSLLRSFHGHDHDSLIKRFQELDKEWIDISRKRIAQRLHDQCPSFNGVKAGKGSQMGLILAETRKKTRHMSLRRLFKECGAVIKDVKPCFMMSPISVAQYLEPGGMNFDVVIFDEASQIEPADAFGAIARGQQIILVGDENQLPPTNFFNKVEAGDEDNESTEIRTADLESILAVGAIRLGKTHMLRWHYRSAHDSLITFSNYSFYGNQLRTFPSSLTNRSVCGLSLVHVSDGVYQRGKGQDNPIEARRIANAVVEHAKKTPDMTLGVGAFSSTQQRRIEDEIEILRRSGQQPELEDFLRLHEYEPFFVKNLETIQGDERDVILLSVGYGRDQNKKLTMNFGPLNRDGGWRRLNVLITRARRRCVVYTSILAEDIDLSKTKARGVKELKGFLEFAQSGDLLAAEAPLNDHDSPFEASVCEALRKAGWEVHAQVGCAGFAIDLAVVDSRASGRYLAGIECDGATYHSSATARDRDRLRQEVLERLGWKILRIWSTDWFVRPKQSLAKILEDLNKLRKEPIQNQVIKAIKKNQPVDKKHVPKQFSENKNVRSTSTVNVQSKTTPLKTAVQVKPSSQHLEGVVDYCSQPKQNLGELQDLLDTPKQDLSEKIRSLVTVEGPIHKTQAIKTITSWYSTKSTKKTRSAFNKALHILRQNNLIEVNGEFLSNPNKTARAVRFRGGDCPVTKADYIPPEEYELALVMTLKKNYGCQRDVLISETVRLMGFKRSGSALKEQIDNAIQRLVFSKTIELDSSGFVNLKK